MADTREQLTHELRDLAELLRTELRQALNTMSPHKRRRRRVLRWTPLAALGALAGVVAYLLTRTPATSHGPVD